MCVLSARIVIPDMHIVNYILHALASYMVLSESCLNYINEKRKKEIKKEKTKMHGDISSQNNRESPLSDITRYNVFFSFFLSLSSM